MFKIFFFIAFTIITTNALIGMDPAISNQSLGKIEVLEKSKSPKKRRSFPFGQKKSPLIPITPPPSPETSQRFSNRKRSISSPQLPDKFPFLPQIKESDEMEHGFIIATSTLNISLLEFYLSVRSFNPNKIRDRSGDTAYHIIAAKKTNLCRLRDRGYNEKNKAILAIIKIFLEDPRTDFSLKNNLHVTPRELIKSESENEKVENIDLRRNFFARCSLNIIVNQQAEHLREDYLCGNISPEKINNGVQQIIDTSKAIEKKQGHQEDRALPKASRFPEYATFDFIYQMIFFRLVLITKNN